MNPVRVYFVDDDPAELWQAGDTADDLGPDATGRHLFKLDHYDDKVSIADPYGRGIVRRLSEEEPGRITDEMLDEYLDRKRRGETSEDQDRSEEHRDE